MALRRGLASLQSVPQFRIAFSKPLSHVSRRPYSTGEADVLLDVDNDGFATVTLNRAKQFNTFSDKVIAELNDTWNTLRKEQRLRGVFLQANGKFFSAGADLKWMKSSVNFTKEQNQHDAEELSRMLLNLNTLPCATVALVQGPAFGGGVGLVSCCDVAIAVPNATFTLSEVKLGLIPATISPYVVQRIGPAQSRRYMLTAEAITAQRAQEIGLIHEIATDADDLVHWKEQLRSALANNAPGAVAASKQLVWTVTSATDEKALVTDTAKALADQRASPEGQGGLQAFFNKQPAPWTKSDES